MLCLLPAVALLLHLPRLAGAAGTLTLAAVRFDIKVHNGENEYGYGPKFYVDGVVSTLANPLVLRVGETYEFLQAYPNNMGYLVRFSTVPDVVDNTKGEFLVSQLGNYYPELAQESLQGLLKGYLQYQATKDLDMSAISKSALRAVAESGPKGLVKKTYCTPNVTFHNHSVTSYNETTNVSTHLYYHTYNTTNQICTGGQPISASEVQEKILSLTTYDPFGREELPATMTEFTNRMLHVGTAGQADGKTQLIPDESYPDVLYMYCDGFPGMGGKILITRQDDGSTASGAGANGLGQGAQALVGAGGGAAGAGGYVQPSWQQVTDFAKRWMKENGRVYYDSDMSALGKPYSQTIRWKGSAMVLGLLLPGMGTDSGTGQGTVDGGNWAGSYYNPMKQTLTLLNHDENRWWAMKLQCKADGCEYRFINMNAVGKNFASKGPMYRDFEKAFVSATGDAPPADAGLPSGAGA